MSNYSSNNEFEHAHQAGLSRGFDLGWTYKGKFDRVLLEDLRAKLNKQLNKIKNQKGVTATKLKNQISVLNDLEILMLKHPNNREGISINFW
jgi:hypothetical protein